MDVDEIEKLKQRIKNPYRYIEDKLEHGDQINFNFKYPSNFLDICKNYYNLKQKLHFVKAYDMEV